MHVHVQCNLDYLDPFGHRLILAYQISEIVQITEIPTFLA